MRVSAREGSGALVCFNCQIKQETRVGLVHLAEELALVGDPLYQRLSCQRAEARLSVLDGFVLISSKYVKPAK